MRLKYFGKLERMSDSRLPKMMLHGQLREGERAREGQPISLHRCIKDDLGVFGIDDATCKSMITDATKWEALLTGEGADAAQDVWVIAEQARSSGADTGQLPAKLTGAQRRAAKDAARAYCAKLRS